MTQNNAMTDQATRDATTDAQPGPAVAGPVERRVRVLWLKERAPLKIKDRCPICGAGLLLDAGEATELEDATGEWIATEINLECESEPDIDSDEWDEWHRWHYRMPYVDWLPLEQRILSAVRRKYHFAPNAELTRAREDVEHRGDASGRRVE